jgi:hypothetical protein
VWSGDSAWGALWQRPLSRLLPALGTALVSPERAQVYALAETRPVEDWLLALDGPEPKLAFCSPDAHGYPSYGAAFRWMSVHLTGITALPEAPAEGAQAVVQEPGPVASTVRWMRWRGCRVRAPPGGPADVGVGEVSRCGSRRASAGRAGPGARPRRMVDASHLRLEARRCWWKSGWRRRAGARGRVLPRLLAQPVKVEAAP